MVLDTRPDAPSLQAGAALGAIAKALSGAVLPPAEVPEGDARAGRRVALSAPRTGSEPSVWGGCAGFTRSPDRRERQGAGLRVAGSMQILQYQVWGDRILFEDAEPRMVQRLSPLSTMQ